MPIPNHISDRINLLRFPLCVAVVFIHSRSVQNEILGSAIAREVRFITYLVSEGLARNAVPLFFLISGILFFSNFSYLRKIKSRFKTLIIPYLIWNIALIMVLFLLQYAGIGILWGKPPIKAWTAYNFTDAILGIGKPPINYPLWFMRDLIILAISSPFFYVISKIRYLKWFALCALFALWIADPVAIIPEMGSILFFYLGCLIAQGHASWIDRIGKFGYLLVPAFILIIIADAAISSYDLPRTPYLTRIGLALGVLLVWTTASKYVNFAKDAGATSGFSFFIFASHAPILGLISIILYKTFNSNILIMSLYFIIPLFAILSAIGAAWVLKNCFSSTAYNFLVGGR